MSNACFTLYLFLLVRNIERQLNQSKYGKSNAYFRIIQKWNNGIYDFKTMAFTWFSARSLISGN